MRRAYRRGTAMFSDFRPTAILTEAEKHIADVIGRGRAMLLSHRVRHLNPYRKDGRIWGALYVPKRINEAFVQVVGDRKTAQSLVESFAGEQVQLGGCRIAFKQMQQHAIRFLRRQGLSAAILARVSFLTERQIRRICEGVAVEPDACAADLSMHVLELHAFSLIISQRPCMEGNHR